MKFLSGSLLENSKKVDKRTKVGNMVNIFAKAGLKNMEQKADEMKSKDNHFQVPHVLPYENLVCSYDLLGSIQFWNVE